MKKIAKIALLFLITGCLFAQGSAGTAAKYEYRKLIDVPTAGILEKGNVGTSIDVLPGGDVISRIEVGIYDNVSFGISYGGGNVIGSGEIDWYKIPGVNIRVRLIDETLQTPAVTLGFDSQGKGDYYDDVNRYEIKSPGFFAAAAKNFEFLGFLSLHGVINYSLERDDGDENINLAIGLEKTIGPQVSIVAEYDFAINDNNEKASFGDGKGYLNVGARWSVGDGFTIGLDLRNMLDNKKFTSSKADRAIFVEYIKSIF